MYSQNMQRSRGLMPTVQFNDIAEEAIQRDASLIAKHKHVLVKGWCVRFY